MNIVFAVLRIIGYILLPMFFRPKSNAGLYGVLHVLVVIGITVGLGFVHYHFKLSRHVPTAPPWLRNYWLPILFLLCYLLAWFGWWLWKLFQADEEASRFPDLDAAWAEAESALTRAGIGLGDTPIYLMVGRFSGDEAVFFQAGSALAVSGAPGAGAPLRVFARREAIYVTCSGASLCGRQAELLEGAGYAAAPSPDASVGASMAVDKSIGMSMAAGPVADVQQIIRKAREEGRNLTPAEHALIRQMTGIVGGQTGPAPAARSSHASVLKDQGEADHHSARLRYLCRLIARSRWPLCPINGVVLLISMNATDTDHDADQMAMVALRDLQTVRDGARLHCPVFAVVGDMARLEGSDEFLKQFPADKLRQRLGKGFPLVPDIPPDSCTASIEQAVRWIFDSLIPFWVFKLFRIERPGETHAEPVQANAQLFYFLNDVRERTARLSRLIAKAVVIGMDAPPLFGGCYLAGGEIGGGPAFVPGFLKRLEESQGYVAWTAEAFDADARYKSRTQTGYVALAVAVVAVAALGVWFAIKK